MHALSFAFPHQPILDKIGLEPVPKGFVAEQGNDRGIHAARQRVDGLALDLGGNFLDLGIDEFFFVQLL